MKLWRIHFKSDYTKVDAVKFCIDNKVLGVGWEVNAIPRDKEEYWRLGEGLYGDNSWNRTMKALLYEMSFDDLIWIKDPMGIYYLGRVEGDWKYKSDKEYLKAGIVNTRKCAWYEIGTMDYIPEKVLNSFRLNTTLQQIHDISSEEYSKHIFNIKAETSYYSTDGLDIIDILSL